MANVFPLSALRLAVAASCLWTAIGVGKVSAQTETKLTMGVIGTGSAQQWALWIAQKKGFLARRGANVEIIVTPSAAAVMQQILAGALDVGTSGLTSPVRAIDQGIGIAILGIETQAAPYSVWAKPAITKLADLRGRTIMVGGAKDITRNFLELMIIPAGVAKDDYSLVYAGSASARFSALATGAVDAVMLNPPFSFKAEAAGFKNIGNLVDTVSMPFTGYVVSSVWAKANKSALTAFAEAIVEGVAWFNDDANRDEAIDIQQKMSGAVREEVAATYNLYRQLDVFPRNGALQSSKIGTIIKLLKDDGELSGAADVSRFIDAEVSQIFPSVK